MQISEESPRGDKPTRDRFDHGQEPAQSPLPDDLQLPVIPERLQGRPEPESPILNTPLPLHRKFGDSLSREPLQASSIAELREIQAHFPLLQINTEQTAKGLGLSPSYYRNGGFYKETFASKSIEELSETIEPRGVDLETMRYIEFEQIWQELSRSAGLLASTAIAQSALRLTISEEVIAARQDAYRELLSNPVLASNLSNMHENLVSGWEGPIADFLVQGCDFPNSCYSDFVRMRESLRGIVKATEGLEPQSTYMKMLQEDVLGLKESETYRLVTEGIVRTEEGLKPKSEVSFGQIASKFRPWLATPSVVALTTAALSATVASVPYSFQSFANFITTAGCALATGAAYHGTAMFNAAVNQKTVAAPLQQIAATDQKLHKAIEALSRLGELSAGLRYINDSVVPLQFPRVIEAPNHFFKAKRMRSPLFNKNPAYVPSDVEITEQGITFVTGPNSGGKTTVARALLLNQLQAQMGLPIPVEEAQIGIADNVAYQVPEFNDQDDSEGRFGVELSRTRDIVFRAGSRTFNILDELAEGTTAQEKAVYSRAILDSLTIKGSTTILITHDLELTKLYKKLGIGNYLQVEFKDGNPTHRLVEGISESSHADRVARKIGFSIDDIVEDLRQGGHIQ